LFLITPEFQSLGVMRRSELIKSSARPKFAAAAAAAAFSLSLAISNAF
jgi:hypothetical protein